MPRSSDLSSVAFKRVERRLAGGKHLRTTRLASRRMSGIRREDTNAELSVRRIARAMGLRYTIRNRDLVGSPDLANRSRRFVVFVHGCFWHRHPGCPRTTIPKSNTEFWRAKFERNRQRDRQALACLRRSGYQTVVIWECETKMPAKIAAHLRPLLARNVVGN